MAAFPRVKCWESIAFTWNRAECAKTGSFLKRFGRLAGSGGYGIGRNTKKVVQMEVAAPVADAAILAGTISPLAPLSLRMALRAGVLERVAGETGPFVGARERGVGAGLEQRKRRVAGW